MKRIVGLALSLFTVTALAQTLPIGGTATPNGLGAVPLGINAISSSSGPLPSSIGATANGSPSLPSAAGNAPSNQLINVLPSVTAINSALGSLSRHQVSALSTALSNSTTTSPAQLSKLIGQLNPAQVTTLNSILMSLSAGYTPPQVAALTLTLGTMSSPRLVELIDKLGSGSVQPFDVGLPHGLSAAQLDSFITLAASLKRDGIQGNPGGFPLSTLRSVSVALGSLSHTQLASLSAALIKHPNVTLPGLNTDKYQKGVLRVAEQRNPDADDEWYDENWRPFEDFE